MLDPMAVFDRRLVRRHRERAAERFARHDFLKREVAARLADRLSDTTRRFARVLDLGCHDGSLGRLVGQRGEAELLVSMDLAERFARSAPGLRLVGDEEWLPFAAGSFDLVVSALSLHWVNDLPGALVQINRALKPDGLLLAAMLGGGTLEELRQALLAAELEVEAGASPRVSPFADAAEAGRLLQRAGFALPVVDVDRIDVSYPDAIALMRDLRGMGEANAVAERRRKPLKRAMLAACMQHYSERHAGRDGRLPATFQVHYLTAWSPHADQPKPLRPGSSSRRLATALGATERSAGEKAGPT
jgi:SAM-dependent methyltransferase